MTFYKRAVLVASGVALMFFLSCSTSANLPGETVQAYPGKKDGVNLSQGKVKNYAQPLSKPKTSPAGVAESSHTVAE